MGRRKTTTLISGNTTEYTYEDGVAGLVSSVTNSYGTDSEDVYGYTYDQFGNITKITQNGTVIGEYTYDKLGQLTSDYVQKYGYTATYTYDDGGNVTYVKENGNSFKWFSYNDPVWKDRVTSFNEMQITYDEIGNIVNSYNSTYTWEGRKLVGVDNNITYEYDSDGNRIRKTVGGVITDYYWQNGVLQFLLWVHLSKQQ